MKSPVAILYDQYGDPIDIPNSLPVGGEFKSGFTPDPSSYPTGLKGSLQFDGANSLQTRGPVHSDESSFRDHFQGSSLSSAISGTLTFTNGSTTVTGSGTSFISNLTTQYFIKLNSDSETSWMQVGTIISDTELELVSAYQGSSGSGASSKTYWATGTASGASISVNSSKVTLVNGLSSGAHTFISRTVDYGPLFVQFKASCTSIQSNQDVYFGLFDDHENPTEKVAIQFSSTINNNQVIFRTGVNGQDETSTVTIPGTALINSENIYAFSITGNSVTLQINGKIVAQHKSYLPGPYSVLYAAAFLTNNAVLGSSTSLAIDFFWVNNSNRVEIANSYVGEPVPSQIVGTTSSGLPQAVGVGTTGGLLVESAEFPTFAVSAEDVVLGNNKSLLSIHLDSGSGKIVKLRVIYIRNAQTSATTGVVAAFDLERFTSHSGGTTLTPQSRDTNDSLPSQVTARSNATITGGGTRSFRWEWSSDEWGAGTLDTEGLQVAVQNTFPAFAKKDSALKPFVLRDGQGMHVKCATNTTAGSFDVIFVFTVEEP